MRILVNPNIRRLFIWISLSIVGFTLLSILAVSLQWPFAALWVLAWAVGMGALILAALYRYFQTQDQIMEDAITQIHAYLSGDSDARISCDDEGELNRLFHEVNSLVTILNAHAENEGNAKIFLKDTISNISHQLKTPLAALNILQRHSPDRGPRSPGYPRICPSLRTGAGPDRNAGTKPPESGQMGFRDDCPAEGGGISFRSDGVHRTPLHIPGTAAEKEPDLFRR